MNNLATSYGFEVKGLKDRGIYLIDSYKNRYTRLCSYSDMKTYTKNDLMKEIRLLANKLRPRNKEQSND